MTLDLYEGFAERYDLAFGRFEERDPSVNAFFRRLFDENGVCRVLDCACGTGRHLLLLHTLGCEVWGSDLSESMLAQARKNLADHTVEIPIALSAQEIIAVQVAPELHYLASCVPLRRPSSSSAPRKVGRVCGL